MFQVKPSRSSISRRQIRLDALAVHRHGVVDEVEMARAVVAVERDHLIDDAVGRAEAELLAEQPAGAVGASAGTAARGEDVGVKVGVVDGPKSAGLTRCRAGAGSESRSATGGRGSFCWIRPSRSAIDEALDRRRSGIRPSTASIGLDDGRLAFAHHHGVEAVCRAVRRATRWRAVRRRSASPRTAADSAASR